MIPTFLPTVPQVFVNVDRDKVLKQGIDLGAGLSNPPDFHGRLFRELLQPLRPQWQVYVEAEGDYRTDAKNVGQFYVGMQTTTMVPLDAITTIEDIAGPEFTLRYNVYRSAQINGVGRARLQLGPGDERARRSLRANHA